MDKAVFALFIFCISLTPWVHSQTCYGLTFSNASVCSGHGSCVANDVCVCLADYSNNNCSTYCAVSSQWASSVNGFSTQYSTVSYSANQVLGPPNFYPSYGDSGNSWCPTTVGAASEFLDLQFPNSVTIAAVAVYETWTPGGVSGISAFVSGSWISLYSVGSTAYTGTPVSRIFAPTLIQGYTSNRIRVDFKLTGFPTWYEIDTVRLDGGSCATPIHCFGILKTNTSSVCSGRGTCVGTNNCTCFSTYGGFNCNVSVCYSKLSTDATVCSGNGTCLANNNCTCNPGYSGQQCQFYSCFGVNYTSYATCSGHGSCISVDTCTCQNGYSGPNCQPHVTCNGLNQANPRVCSGRGQCVSNNTCLCAIGYAGANCQYTVCNNISSAASGVVCNGTGVCRSPSFSVQYNFPYNYPAPYGDWSGPPLILGFRDFDISAMIFKTSAANNSIIWSYDRNADNNTQFRLESPTDGSLAFYSSNSDATDAHAATSAVNIIQLNTWYNILVSRRGVNVSIYVNTSLVASNVSIAVYDMASTVANRPNFLIGSRYQSNGTTTELPFVGFISQVFVVSDSFSLQPVCACSKDITGNCKSCSGICIDW